jgi:hypothetical protein
MRPIGGTCYLCTVISVSYYYNNQTQRGSLVQTDIIIMTSKSDLFSPQYKSTMITIIPYIISDLRRTSSLELSFGGYSYKNRIVQDKISIISVSKDWDNHFLSEALK